MSLVAPLVHALYTWGPSTAVRQSEVAFPVIQTFHILGIVLMAGTIAIVDLRLLGLAFRGQAPAAVARPLLPITWTGFAVMVLSGGLLFAAQSEKIFQNVFLQVKLGLLLVAGVNVILFHATTYRAIATWSASDATPRHAQIAAGLSLLLWAGVIIAGRFIAYF